MQLLRYAACPHRAVLLFGLPRHGSHSHNNARSVKPQNRNDSIPSKRVYGCYFTHSRQFGFHLRIDDWRAVELPITR
jgi:hypothetical protein